MSYFSLNPFLRKIATTNPNIDPQVNTPQFKAWFGNSKVVDIDGNPLRLIHGTQQVGDFTVFEGKAFAAFGTPDTNLSNLYAGNSDGSRSIPVYFKAEKPAYFELDLNTEILPWRDEKQEKPEDWDDEQDGEWVSDTDDQEGITEDELIDYLGLSAGEFYNLYNSALQENPGHLQYPQVWQVVNSKAFRKFLERLGYDSFLGTEGGTFVWAVMNPTQVKSAYGNDGSYALNTGNIHASLNKILRKKAEIDQISNSQSMKTTSKQPQSWWQLAKNT